MTQTRFLSSRIVSQTKPYLIKYYFQVKAQHVVDKVEGPKILVKFGLRVTFSLSTIFHMRKQPQFKLTKSEIDGTMD